MTIVVLFSGVCRTWFIDVLAVFISALMFTPFGACLKKYFFGKLIALAIIVHSHDLYHGFFYRFYFELERFYMKAQTLS